jgi:hypothetical protein
MKKVLLYLILVGIPVLAVLGILQLGRGLTAPIAVAGTWNIEKNSPLTTVSTCGALPISSDKPALTIIQAGSHLQLRFNDKDSTTLTGELHEQTISTTTTPSQSQPAIRLEAGVNRQPEPDSMQGVLTFTQCPSQPAVTFTAMHQDAVR